MLAIKGQYENGVLALDEKAPVNTAKVIVIFPTEINEISSMSTDERYDTDAMSLFHKFTGSIDRDFDYEKEKDECLDEKYGYLS